MRHIFAIKDDFIVFSGTIDASRLDIETRGKITYLHLYTKDEFIGVIACDKYVID